MPKPRKKPRKKTSNHFFLKLTLTLSVVLAVALIYLDAKVRYTLNERQWQMPARVYSHSLTLFEGRFLAPGDFVYQLRLMGYSEQASSRQPGSFTRRANVFQIYSRGFQSIEGRVEPVRFRLEFDDQRIKTLEKIAGGYLPEVELEPLEIGSIYPSHREDRLLLRLDEVPNSLIEILLLVEDRRFYQHLGVSPRAIARAMMVNIKAGRTVQGGSTITQQLVKNVFLSQSRSLWRKAVEAIMAMMVELHYSKQKILESYLNEVYLGQEGSRSIHGFALASRHYFNRPLENLDAGQVALLVGMVKGPSYYDPWRNPERARERRNVVLAVMAKNQLITPGQATAYEARGLGLAKSSAMEGVYPAYLDLVRRQLRRDYSAQSLQTEGMKIFTSFDPLVQHHAEQSVARVMSGLDKNLEAAMVVVKVDTGDVLAVVGGRRMRFAGFNRALDAVRPIGSLVKPAVYLAALEQPRRYTLATAISDGPVEVAGPNNSLWQPKNFDKKSHGQVLLHRALSNSYNQATARLGMEMGIGEVANMIKRLGVKRVMPQVPALTLGAGSLSPLEVAGMYQTIAAKGVHSPLRSIVDIANAEGRALARYPVQQVPVVEDEIVHLLHYSLIEVVREGTGKAVYRYLPEDYAVAGKTGSTNDLRDSWFAGFAGDYLAVVWLGHDNNKSTGLTGSAGALKVWAEFMASASHQPLDLEAPQGVVYKWIDDSSGLLSRRLCENSRYMPFLLGSGPQQKADCETSLPGVLRWFQGLFE